MRYFYFIITISLFIACKGDYDYQKKHSLKPHSHEHHNHSHEHDEEGHLHDEGYDKIAAKYKTREIWQDPTLVISLLGDIRNQTIAEIGAETGYFVFRIAQRAAKVIATDIDPGAIDYIEKSKMKFPEGFRTKIETRLAQPDNSNLNPNEVDVVMLVNTYVYIQNRVEYFTRLRNAIKDGGRVMIVDYKKKTLPSESLAPPFDIRLSQAEVEMELKKAGFSISSSDDTSLIYQYIIVANKN